MKNVWRKISALTYLTKRLENLPRWTVFVISINKPFCGTIHSKGRVNDLRLTRQRQPWSSITHPSGWFRRRSVWRGRPDALREDLDRWDLRIGHRPLRTHHLCPSRKSWPEIYELKLGCRKKVYSERAKVKFCGSWTALADYINYSFSAIKSCSRPSALSISRSSLQIYYSRPKSWNCLMG